MISRQTLRVCPEEKSVPTPHQVRGRLFPDRALAAGRARRNSIRSDFDPCGGA
jgi:hypothetical protein